jgi:putative SOS response-associated peptidase YedK
VHFAELGQHHIRNGSQLASFRQSWANGWRCIIPAEAFYEPNWELGKAERWIIQQPGSVPMGIAGIYRKWRQPDGPEVFNFAMLTVNADGHPVMQRFHKPGEEKHIVVILDPQDYGQWLSCHVEDAAAFFKQWQGTLEASAAALPTRVPKSSSVRTARPLPPGDARFVLSAREASAFCR